VRRRVAFFAVILFFATFFLKLFVGVEVGSSVSSGISRLSSARCY
jgi:hypothetical protein